MTSKILLISLALLLSSCSGTLKKYGIYSKTDEYENITEISSQFNEKYKLYEVLVTDTIASVARKTDVSAEDIIKYNSLKKPYFLKPGETLKIPMFKSEDDELLSAIDSLEDSKHTSQRHIQIAPKKS
jgi:LysM repeat protein